MNVFQAYEQRCNTVVYAFKWDGGEVPQELIFDERISVILVKGEKCLEVKNEDGSFTRIRPGSYLVKGENNRYVGREADGFEPLYQLKENQEN